MYMLTIVALMIVFPLLSMGVQAALHEHAMPDSAVMLEWFVFWAVGIRLLLAGLRQIIQPRYTAETILGISAPEARVLVRELGFANVAMGSTAASTLVMPEWTTPMAMVGALFYGLAGINHFLHQKRSRLQNIAMASDLYATLVLLSLTLATR